MIPGYMALEWYEYSGSVDLLSLYLNPLQLPLSISVSVFLYVSV